MNMYLNYALLFVLSLLFQWGLIIYFRKKKAYQNIYELSPKTHQNKQETPSFGGLGLLFSLWSFAFLFSLNQEILWLIAVFSSFASIGFIDDMLALISKSNKGLSAKRKFMIQCIIALISLQSFSLIFTELSLAEYLFYGFIMVGFSNATNLSDGLDGLLAGCSLITIMGFCILLLNQVHYSPILSFLIALMISLFAFLVFNKYPAKIFMGDTGSLALGATFAGIALLLDNITLLLPLGAIYIIETASVILQVGSYKLRKKRIFLMSPLHHHFELLGLKEPAIVLLFWGISLTSLVLYLY